MVVVDINGKEVTEYQPIMNSFGIYIQKYLPSDSMMTYLTKNVCESKGRSVDKQDMIDFINDYHIDWQDCIKCNDSETMEECLSKFKTLNDFFIRKKKITISDTTNNTLCSPADARTVIFKNEKQAKKLWIKGNKYCLNCMLRLTKPLGKYYENANIIISRLAPQDYHRFHSPISGKYHSHYEIEGTYKSVNPTIVNSKKNVYTENARIVYFIETKKFGMVAMCFVGASCIGSIKLHKKTTIKKGDELGYFGFGGSTIITVIPENKDIHLNSVISKNTRKLRETYMKVGDIIVSSKK